MKFIIAFLLLISLGFSCRDHGATCPNYFQIPLELYPAKLEYHIGDTISIISKFSRYVQAYSIEDNDLGKIDMKGVYWSPVSIIYRIDSLDIPNKVRYSVITKYFDYIKDTFDFNIFNFSDGGTWLIGEYAYNNDTFNLKYKLVTKRPGIFQIVHTMDENKSDYPGKCSGSTFYVNFKMNDGGNNNVELLKDSPIPIWNSPTYPESFNRFGGYCFKVLP